MGFVGGPQPLHCISGTATLKNYTEVFLIKMYLIDWVSWVEAALGQKKAVNQ